MRGWRSACALTAAVAAFVGAPAALAGGGHATTCNGMLAAGTYHRVVVPEGAVCMSEGPVTIRGGLYVGAGATLVLGSEESAGSTSTINGGVRATNAASLQLHFATINGGIEAQGGAGPFGGPFDITWNAIEDNRINGGVTVNGYNGFWFGFIRNRVNGSVNLTNNVLVDADANEYVTNVINGSLNCEGNSPAPQIGDSEGSPNIVTGVKTGQCANL